MSSRINETFDGLITGVTDKGVWARLFNPPAEGKVLEGFEGLDVGDEVKLKLVHVDMKRGFIDFIKDNNPPTTKKAAAIPLASASTKAN